MLRLSENCFLQQQWEESGVQDSIISNRPLLQLLTSVGSGKHSAPSLMGDV